METVPEIDGGDWEGPPANSSEVLRWQYQLVGGGWSESQSRWQDVCCSAGVWLSYMYWMTSIVVS